MFDKAEDRQQSWGLRLLLIDYFLLLAGASYIMLGMGDQETQQSRATEDGPEPAWYNSRSQGNDQDEDDDHEDDDMMIHYGVAPPSYIPWSITHHPVISTRIAW